MTMFKMPFKTNLFNKNQKVFVISTTGQLAFFVKGRHRGKGRYIKAWVKLKAEIMPRFIDVKMPRGFGGAV